MNIRLSHALAAAFASGVAALAIAQAPSSAEPAATPSARQTYVQEPVASAATGGSSANAALASTIAEALNADRSLQGSKFSVVPGEKGIFVSGVTPSVRQMAQAVKLAEQHGSGTIVTSSISTEEVVLDAGAVAPDAQSMVPADEAIAASEREIAARAKAASQ